MSIRRPGGGCGRPLAICAFAMGLVALAVLGASPARAASTLEIVSLSNRPDKVSGGDVLVKVQVPPGTGLGDVTVSLNGADVTAAFWLEPADHALVGLVTGLSVGPNKLQAKAQRAGTGNLTVQNHPITGPVFAGPHEQPFFCQTHQFTVFPTGPTLSATPIDDPCHVPTRVDWVYRTTANSFQPLPAGPPPEDLVTTTTNEGRTVPYIVRIETGTINRAIYQTAVLDDPAVPGPTLQERDPAWNGRLVYTFGGGCRAGWYRQGSTTGGVLNDMMLSQGFAVASASLNVFGNNCNDLLAAETMMMVKERFIEVYGLPRWTIGWGCSGGSYQVHQIGDNYPGLLDGIVPQCSFPDVNFGTNHTLADSRLLLNYLSNAGVAWTDEEMRAVSGFGVFNSIPNLSNGAARIDPVPDRPGWISSEFNAIVPVEVRYDPVTNPAGARATTYDHTVNAFGRDPETGFARRPLDNVGIQYGLGALNAGQITKEQFLDLNEKIGGFDIDAHFVPERMEADRHATRAAYETGRMLSGGGGLAAMPILDFDLIYSDLAPGGDIHMKFQHFSTRERLRQANGHADNHVMWSGANAPRSAFVSQAALAQMDAWVGNVVADPSSDPRAVKVVRNRPPGLTDGCWIGDATPTFVPEPQIFGGSGTSFCNDIYPGFPFPRMVAGAPLANDIVACRLKPIEAADYAVTVTPDEVARLHQIFTRGVCDWTRPGVEQRGLAGTWLEFTDVGKYRRTGGRTE
jgi:hypothetical protein